MKIGILPLYLKLYDEILPDKRNFFESFLNDLVRDLSTYGFSTIKSPICRVKSEFTKAIKLFEQEHVSCILTLHLAYSPSLESIEALSRTKLPIVVFDTTPDLDFSWEQSPDAIMYNHGIHGVQDMCNLLVRNKKPFLIEAGHWKNPETIRNLKSKINAAAIANEMKNMNVGLIGKPFKGMGDFSVPAPSLKKIGINVVKADPEDLAKLEKEINDSEIQSEMALVKEKFQVLDDALDVLQPSIHTGLMVRKWLNQNKLNALSINFEYAGKIKGLKLMPFFEISLALARGIGYAGEGDVLTASLVGSLLKAFPETTFTEMFCPDWKNGRVFLSHMGEWNVSLAHKKPVVKKYEFIFGKGMDTVRALGCLKAGRATFVNLAPLAKDDFRLLVAPGMMETPPQFDKMAETVHGWFRPDMQLEKFLAAYSEAGGTHHSALVYGDVAEELKNFATLMGWDFVIIR